MARQARGTIKVRGDIIERIDAFCAPTGKSRSAFVEERVLEILDGKATIDLKSLQPDAVRARMAAEKTAQQLSARRTAFAAERERQARLKAERLARREIRFN